MAGARGGKPAFLARAANPELLVGSARHRVQPLLLRTGRPAAADAPSPAPPLPTAAGLLGGAVYVNALTLISREVAPPWREFSLGAASLADSVGVALADVAGVLIQGCLYRANNLPGAHFRCGA